MPILIAEDSQLLNKLIVDALHKAGYVHLIHTSNGQEAYDVITDALQKGKLKEEVQCLITDIEMPQMDGYHLTKLIKENDETKDIPVVIFSSIVMMKCVPRVSSLAWMPSFPNRKSRNW